ncbi:hypothetical protein ABZV91_02170 [Nocardia sp. NPDC004568]|uniref:hypothetical protein n=1 Tax=Nocardia sp. NPDC004568 TaxID=3154551 RepID=UPI0033B64679
MTTGKPFGRTDVYRARRESLFPQTRAHLADQTSRHTFRNSIGDASDAGGGVRATPRTEVRATPRTEVRAVGRELGLREEIVAR